MITHLRSSFCAFLCLIAFSVYGQEFSISGKVVDNESKPMSLVNVVLLKSVVDNLNQSSGYTYYKGTATNDDGTFLFEDLDKGTFKVSVSFIGFETYEQIIVLDGVLDLKVIQLNETAESLGEVTITATKPTVDRKPDRLIFNIENTALTEGTTLGVLRSTPGVIVSDGSINIKSTPATIFINKRKVQLTSDELIQLLESAPANSIKSIEVITNPPASYDADSGSVINIIMSKNLVTGYRGNIANNFTQGVFPRYNVSTSHYFKNNKVNVNLNYSYSNKKINRDQDDSVNYLDSSENIDQIWRSDINRNTWSETHNLNLNFDYALDDRNTLSITSTGLYTPYFKYQLKNETDIFNNNNDLISNFTADNLSRDNKYNIGSDLIFTHNFKNESSLTFNGHYTIYDYERNQEVFQDEPGDDDDSEFKTLANQDTQILTGRLDYSLPISENSTFETGVKYSNVDTKSDIARINIINGQEVPDVANTDAFNYDESVFAAYANYSQSWDKWEINVGLRAEQSNIEGTSVILNETNKQNYLNWFPNVSISHQIAEKTTVYGNYKRSIYRPSYTDLNPFTFFINENYIVLGNPNLVPSYKDHYWIGINFLKYFTVEAYYINYDGDIVEIPRQDNEANIIEFTPTNLDKKVDYGFDFAFNYYPSDRWSFGFVTSFYQNIEEADFGNDFVELSQWANYSELQNNLTLLEDRSLNVNLSLTWVGKNLQQLQSVKDRLFSELSISKSVFNKKAVISLEFQDIFNFQDEDRSISYLNQLSNSRINIDNRTVRLGFRYNFGNTKLSTNERATEVEERERLKDLN